MRRLAFAALWIALTVQVVWIGIARLVLHSGVGALAYPALVSAGFGMLAVVGGRWRWLSTLLRICIGFAFVSSVADRFGIFGPGTPGVSWGDFGRFVAYTRQVNGFLPAAAAPLLAVLATLLETSLGFGLMLGVGTRATTKAAAFLLLLFGSAMTASLGIGSPFPYAVFVLSAGAWALSTIDSSGLSIDAVVARRGGVRHAVSSDAATLGRGC